MLHRFVDTIRQASHASGFCVYLGNLQRSRGSGLPTVEEAKKDYRDRFHSTVYHSFF